MTWPLDIGVLNLYDTGAGLYGPADVTLVGASVGRVSGSIVYDEETASFCFVKTGGPLTPDTYTLTLRGAADGVADGNGNILDGDGDGAQGGDYVTTFVVAPSSARLLSLPDFTRGPGQAVNVPAAGDGVPVTISDGTDVVSISFVFTYNPDLLNVAGISLATGVPADWSISTDLTTTGQIPAVISGTTPLNAGKVKLVSIQAGIPAAAGYSEPAVLSLNDIQVNGGAMEAEGDSAMQTVAYLGDVTGNYRYSSLDASYISRLVVGIGTGFADSYRLKDPVLIGDVSGNGSIGSLDASYVARKAVGQVVSQIPDLPGILPTEIVGGPDPLLRIPNDLIAEPGDSLSVPIFLDMTYGNEFADPLLAGDIVLAYDPAVLSPTDVVLGALIPGWNLTWYTPTAGVLAMSFYSSSYETDLAGDTPEGVVLDLTFTVLETAPLGTTALDITESVTVDFQTYLTYLNEGDLTLTVEDGAVDIRAANHPPVATDDVLTVSEDEQRTITAAELLSNDSDPDLTDTLSIVSFQTAETRGTLTDNGDGTFPFDPRAGFDDLSAGESATYVFTYTVGDGRGGEDVGQVAITVTGVNDAPTITTLTVSPSPLDENATVTLQGTFTDPDSSGAYTVTVVDWGDGSDADVVVRPSGSMTFSFTHQYRDDVPGDTSSDTYAIAVTVEDDTGEVGTEQTTATVNNVAQVLSGLAASDGNENDVCTLTGTITDPGALDTFTVTIDWGDGTAVEEFSSTAGTFNRPHVYADDGAYSIAVEVEDDDLGQDTAGATATILNVAPTVDAGGPYTIEVGNALALSGSVTDPGTQDLLLYAWDLDGDGAFDDAGGATATLTWVMLTGLGLAGGHTYTILLRVSDDHTFTDDSATLTIDSGNDAPTVDLVDAVASLPENTDTASRIKVADIAVTDDGMGTNVLSLAGADAFLFEIEGLVLYLKAGTSLDHETNPQLGVTVAVDDDTVGATPDDTADLSITITDVNEAPTVALANVIASLPENTDTSARIKTADIVVADDALGTHVLGLAGADASLFEIISGLLYLKAGTALDHETNSQLGVTVTVDDGTVGATPDDTADLSIAITDVNEPPTVALTNTVTSLPDNTDTSARIKAADIVVTDDALGTNALSLAGADASLFEIVGMALYLKAGTSLDYETNPQLGVTVTVDDAAVGATPDATANLSITIVDATPPSALLITGILEDTSVAGDGITADNTLVIHGTAEAGSTVELFLAGGSLGTVGVNMIGVWSFDYTGTTLPDGTYSFTATATDAAGNTSPVSASFAVVVDTVAPVVTVDSLTTSDPTPALTGTVNDPDAFVDVTIGGNTYMAMNNGDGTWTLLNGTIDPALVLGTYEVMVHATDGAGNVGTDATANELVIVSAAQPVYRFWSPVYSRHFYTIKVTERDKLINNYAHVWTYEGVAYKAFADNSPPGVAPVYRFWSDSLKAHFYTIKAGEKDKLIRDYPHIWTYEGVAFYAYPPSSPAPGTSPVYRFWSATLNTHFYTIKEAEKNKLINNYPDIWTFEGIAWYAIPPSQAVPAAVDDRVSVSLGSTREDVRTGRTSKQITVTNTSLTAIRDPLWVVITSISDPAVTLAGSGGDTADGYKYVEIGLPGDGQLDPAERAGIWLYFENPLRRPFNFGYSIRGVI